MADQLGDAPAVESPLPPLNLPIQPVNSLLVLSKLQGANNPNQADMWPQWLQHFERYQIASGVQNNSNQEQVPTFLYAKGDCAHDIVKTLSINKATASFAILQPVTMLSLNEQGSIDEDKSAVNLSTPLFKIYTTSPKIVSTGL